MKKEKSLIKEVTPEKVNDTLKKKNMEEATYERKFSEKEMLQFLSSQGIIDLNVVRTRMAKHQEEELLAMHKASIWQLSDGRWATYVGSSKNRWRVRKSTKEALERYLIEYYKSVVDDPTFQLMFDRWIEEKLGREDILLQSADRYTNIFKMYIVKCKEIEHFAEMKIRLITVDDLNRVLYPLMQDRKVTRKDLSNLLTILRGVFRKAAREHLTDIDIISYVNSIDKPRKGFKSIKKRPEDESFSDEEQKVILPFLLKEHDVRSLGLYLLFETGMRVGELAGLKKCDVDEDRIHICRTEAHFKNIETKKNTIIVEDFTKTDAGNRTVIVTPVGRQILKELMQIAPESEWLLTEPDGKRIHECGFRHKLTRVCNKLNIPCRSPHKIRKTYATTLMYSEVKEDVIKYLMGHSDIMTTRRNYVITKTDDAFIRGELSKAFAVNQ